MNIIPMVCPKCNANLSVEEGRKECFCQYCGMYIVIEDNVKRSYHEVNYRNEAKIKQAEVRIKELEHELEMTKLKIEEGHKLNVRKILVAVDCASAIIFILTILLSVSGRIGDSLGIISASLAITVVLTIYLVISGIIGIFKN